MYLYANFAVFILFTMKCKVTFFLSIKLPMANETETSRIIKI